MQDCVIGAITGYKYDQVKYWVNSLNRSGFQGAKILVCYNIDRETLDQLNVQGIQCALIGDDGNGGSRYDQKNFNIVVERFYHYWVLLKTVLQERFRYIIATDVKDVIFQQNPSTVIEKLIGSQYLYLLSSESLRYRDEPWGNNNLYQSFGPTIHSVHTNNAIVNCGVLAGNGLAMTDLFLNLFLATGKAPNHVPGGGGPDQAALNILMNSHPYCAHTYVASTLETWACQLGTQGDPRKIESFAPHLLHPLPQFKAGEYVSPVSGEPYAICHQWDRMEALKVNFIMEKYS